MALTTTYLVVGPKQVTLHVSGTTVTGSEVVYDSSAVAALLAANHDENAADTFKSKLVKLKGAVVGSAATPTLNFDGVTPGIAFIIPAGESPTDICFDPKIYNNAITPNGDITLTTTAAATVSLVLTVERE